MVRDEIISWMRVQLTSAISVPGASAKSRGVLVPKRLLTKPATCKYLLTQADAEAGLLHDFENLM